MNILINDTPFAQEGIDSLEIKLIPLDTSDIIRAQDGTLLHAPQDARMQVILEGKGCVHPALCDVFKGARFTISHPLPLWTTLESPPRLHQGPLMLKNNQKGYMPIFTCILRDFHINTHVTDLKSTFKFVFEEV